MAANEKIIKRHAPSLMLLLNPDLAVSCQVNRKELLETVSYQ
jgi:hypothetical protein